MSLFYPSRRARIWALAAAVLLSACGSAGSGLFGSGSGSDAMDASAGVSNAGGAFEGSGGDSAGVPNGSAGQDSSSGGAAGAPTSCAPEMKPCNGGCVTPDPSVGCGGPECGACLSPDDGVAICTDGGCDYVCNDGFVKTNAGCAAPGDGGVGVGGAGQGGSSNGTGGLAGALTSCPSTRPKTGDLCLKLAFNCPYGATRCSCLAAAMLPIWACK